MNAAIAGGVLAGAALAAGGCAYAAMWPGSQLFGPTLIAPRRPGEIALTFDDGPNPACTPRLLELLAKHDVKATFFLVGNFAQQEPVLARAVADTGHEIGNHTWTHPNLARTAASKVRHELRRTSEVLEQITGNRVRFFRPPFGARRPAVLRIARELGMEPVLWNAMTSDWKQPSGARIAAELSRKIDAAAAHGRAANVVLHDGGHTGLGADRNPSLEAVKVLLERYAGSRTFVTLDRWA